VLTDKYELTMLELRCATTAIGSTTSKVFDRTAPEGSATYGVVAGTGRLWKPCRKSSSMTKRVGCWRNSSTRHVAIPARFPLTRRYDGYAEGEMYSRVPIFGCAVRG